ncbi:tetratricopeptide repeat protein [Leptospira sp. 96542]|nr:tetratricopeptide repeat protein [Leptospira sp. 96542]
MITDNMQSVLKHYNLGLALYKERKFPQAKEEFQKALSFHPTDGPSKLYIDRCDDYIADPPPEDWDGVYNMKTK